MSDEPVQCVQCGQKAVFYYQKKEGIFPLCLSCNLIYQQTLEIERVQHEREYNQGIAECNKMVESITGIPGTWPLIPERTINKSANMTFNNFTLNNSSVGVLNTGNLKMVDTNITVLNGNPKTHEAGDAISKLMDAIGKSDLPDEKKNEAIELLATISSEAVLPKEKRKTSVLKAVLSHLPTILKTSTAAITVWEKVSPHLHSLLHAL